MLHIARYLGEICESSEVCEGSDGGDDGDSGAGGDDGGAWDGSRGCDGGTSVRQRKQAVMDVLVGVGGVGDDCGVGGVANGEDSGQYNSSSWGITGGSVGRRGRPETVSG
jgi:hypothetical protein